MRTHLSSWRLDLDTEFIGLVVVVLHVSTHLSPVVGEEDALARLQAHACHASEAGPDQLRVAVLTALHLDAVEPHCVARVRCQVDTVVVLREGRRRLYRLDHARVVQSVISQCCDARPNDGALR